MKDSSMLPKVLAGSKTLIDINFYYSVYKCAEMSIHVREGEKQTPNQVTDSTWVGRLVLAAGEITRLNGPVH